MPAITTSQALPMLDIRRADGTAVERAAFLPDLRAAAGSHVFFHLSGHGIDPPLVCLRDLSKRFFALTRPIDQQPGACP